MIHILLHFLIPVLFALIFYRRSWLYVSSILIATMVVDIDHLLADPIYDPLRCSINYHPLHSYLAIGVYAFLFSIPLITKDKIRSKKIRSRLEMLQLIGLGLIIHMILDGIDCM